MKKIMVLGAVDSGKTSLLLGLSGKYGEATKTQTLEYSPFTIDTPGEYMENPMMYKSLMSTALEAKVLIFTQDSTRKNSIYPPGFARAFSCMTIGVVTKIDSEECNTNLARKFLEHLKLRGPIFEVSALRGDGIKELKNFLNKL